MAKRDVVKYFKDQQEMYLDMVESAKAVDEAFKAGRFEESAANAIKEQINVMRQNYERIAYIMYLLNMPIKEANKEEYIDNNFCVEDYLKQKRADAYSVNKESKKALEEFKRIIKEDMNNE